MSAARLEINAETIFPTRSIRVELDEHLDGITALFGPSGGGKSTLLRMVAGLETRCTGQIGFDGQPWLDTRGPGRSLRLPAHKRPVGMVFQDGRLFAHLDVTGNLRYAARRAGRDARIGFDEVVAALDLAPLLGRDPIGLSGGERQRVALGRTLLTSPRLLLLDEPLSALDIGRKAEILPYLRDVPARFGIPALYVSHAIEEVAQLASRVIVLAEGEVRATGPVEEVLSRIDLQGITGRFEAGALLMARVVGDDPEYQLTKLDLEGQPLLMPRISQLENGETIRLRLRARDVTLATSRPEGISTRNILSGTITRIAPEQDTAFAEVFVSIGAQQLRARVTRDAVNALGLRETQNVYALVKSASFDRRGIGMRDAGS